jgi:hypothetical protein
MAGWLAGWRAGIEPAFDLLVSEIFPVCAGTLTRCQRSLRHFRLTAQDDRSATLLQDRPRASRID